MSKGLATETKLNTSRLGHHVEMRAVVYLMECGYDVFWNLSPEGPADLMVWDRVNTPKPIDVKTYNPLSAAHKHTECAENNVKVLWYVKGHKGQGQFSWSIREAGRIKEQYLEAQDREETGSLYNWDSEPPLNRYD
jgi:hypothetical protein